MHAVDPRNGVRYELVFVDGDAEHARYDATVFTGDERGRARVVIRRDGAVLDGASVGIAEAHLAQLLALARALGRRDGAAWPRRINRWRAPGVR